MGNYKKVIAAMALLTLVAPAASAYQPTYAQSGFADAAFQRVWTRTDKLVADKSVVRSWYWGPGPGESKTEKYVQGAGGTRKVQYFDKSRMEINDPSKNQNDPFFVTNGLLTIELISGKMQVGDTQYETRYPANIPLASDIDDQTAPTYQSFGLIANSPLGDHPAPDQTGKTIAQNVNRAGIVARDPGKEKYGAKYARFATETKHNIADKFWDFLNISGNVVGTDGKTTNAKLSDPWFYTTGLPISEPYWANVKIAGKPEDVLIQLFERRVLTYVPSFTAEWRVQMGNIGAHYYDWRYKNSGQSAFPNPDINPVTVAAGQLGSKEKPLRMAFTPSVQAAAIAANGQPLADLLSSITGYTIKAAAPATSYAAVVSAMDEGNVDIAWLAPFAYVLSHQQKNNPGEVILSAVRKGYLTYPSVFITADPNIKTLADFKGKKFAVVDPTSASGYLYPLAQFRSLGLMGTKSDGTPDIEGFFGPNNLFEAKSHPGVVTAVYNGQVSGGAVFGSPVDFNGNPQDARVTVVASLKDVFQKVRIIGETQQIPNDTVAVGKNLPADMKKQIQQGLLELTTRKAGRDAMYALYQIDDLAPVNDSFYDPLRQVADDLGLLNNISSVFPTPTPRP